MPKLILTLGHSPDPDDAFMFYALAKGLIETGELHFEHILQDIETLNQRAMRGELDVTALSLHAYAYVADRYALLRCGASVGERYGPLVVARNTMTLDSLRCCRIAVPGTMTTAFLTLRLALGDFSYVVLPFDRILEAVATGWAEAGLIIHEGQLTFRKQSLHLSLIHI
ncbi:MAG: ABC transporter substrate-binding protein, partial [Candidatus Sumerlaeia bacterium]|nr:ABC transporter substrate-binding protein [Candidatus Sumerlaeia bacterium]